MPKKKSSRKARGSPRAKPKVVRGRSESVSGDLRKARAAAEAMRAQANDVAKQAERVYRKADQVHEEADDVHKTADNLHKRSRAVKQSKQIPQPRRTPLVVGIGASAGGFEAFSQMLRALPSDTGMVFVTVFHLDPTHKSQLTELLQAATKMPVKQITNRLRVEADTLYVIPPDRDVVIDDGILVLSPRKRSELNLPVDRFFNSLACNQGNFAIGVILSGSGHDGSIGLRQIKAEGGITFAQDERSSGFFSMPQSAIATGCVDYILPPERIARELRNIAEQFKVAKADGSEDPVFSGSEEELARLFALLRGVTGVDFSAYKPTTLKRRITRRMVLKKMTSARVYLNFLEDNHAEVEKLFQEILINVTGFFRDPQVFQALKRRVFPKLMKQRAADSGVRIWVPGCSTGEEVYSLAICLHEFLGRKTNNKAVQIFGTDISDQMVARARQGSFSAAAVADVSPERLRRYFQRVEGGYQIGKFIRDMCVFAKQNVVEDPPFSKLDLISCRNLLIYFGPTLQRKVLPIFHYSLRRGGFLLLGASESVGTYSHLFTSVDKRNKIYTRSESYQRTELDFRPSEPAQEVVGHRPLRGKDPLPRSDLQKQADELVLSRYMPAGIIVNSRMEVLHFRGKTGPYLDPAPGSASFNLIKIIRGELVMDLRTAFSQAMRTNVPVRKEAIRIRYNGHFRDVTVEVVPMARSGGDAERLFLILFFDLHFGETEKAGAKGARQGGIASERQLTRLRDELNQTKESLQTIIEEQEATNEELSSANEEIQSTNEELQSTNEELETAKEELQSTNEELTTLNEELQNRNTELGQVNNDLNNLIASFAMPILILGTDFTLRRFTPMAQKLFNLIPADVGRRITDINPNLRLPNLDKLAAEVIETLNVKEVNALDDEGKTYSVRIRPYRTAENTIEGVVVVAVDTGDPWRDVGDIAEMVAEPVLLLTSDLRINKANQCVL